MRGPCVRSEVQSSQHNLYSEQILTFLLFLVFVCVYLLSTQIIFFCLFQNHLSVPNTNNYLHHNKVRFLF